jgi:Mce-associated membrane protein
MTTTTNGSELSVPDVKAVDDESDTCDNETVEAARDSAAAVETRQPHPKLLRAKAILAYGVLPGLALLLAAGAGFLKYQAESVRQSQAAAIESVQAASDSTIALLSYQPDTADKQLPAARERLTGTFRDEYTKLITDLVIPGAKQKKISAVATVPAAASMSATPNHAVVLLFIDQSVVIGTDAPTATSSTVRVTLQKDQDRWLISQFDPL